MVPYQSARRLQAGNGEFNSKIWLNANEAPGNGEYSVNSDCINRYPDFQPANLIQAYSHYSGVLPDCLLATRGADEGIELIIRTFCRAYQDSILICPPTYGMYAISAANHGANIVEVPLVNQQLDISGLKSQVGCVKVVFLCSPGNPTGNLLNEEDVEKTIEMFASSAIVVVDEAYIEFSPLATVAKWLAKYDNLVVLRTLSKAFSLAGLRCGFTLAPPETIGLLSKIIAPYPISAPVAEIASDVLNSDGLARMRKQVETTQLLAKSLSQWLKKQTWCIQVFPTQANFVLFRCQDEQSKTFVFNSLQDNNILIRDQSKQPQLENCLRISVGSEQELNLLKQTLIKSFQTEDNQLKVVE